MSDSSAPAYGDVMERLLGAAALFHDAETLADLAEIDMALLLQQSGLNSSAKRVGLLGAASKLRSEIRVGREFADVLRVLDLRTKKIALQRTYSRTPVTLAVLGDGFGVTRERARQLEVRLRATVRESVGESLDRAARWLRRLVGPAAEAGEFRRAIDLIVGDSPPEWREAAEVALMQVADFEPIDGLVADAHFRQLVAEARRLAPGLADEIGLVDEGRLRAELGTADLVEWEGLLRNAGLFRVRGRLALRDTRRVRVLLALQEVGAGSTQSEIAEMTGIADNSSLASMLSSDPLFVRVTKNKWGMGGWTDEPYRGVVNAIVRRIEAAGGSADAGELVEDITTTFEILPATVRNYLGTAMFRVENGQASIVESPEAPVASLKTARDVVWHRDGTPALRFEVSEQHLRGNSQKVSPAVAQRLGVGLGGSVRIPFVCPPKVDAASLIWRSYDPNGPELGCLRVALGACGATPGDEAFVLLEREGLRLLTDASQFGESSADDSG